MYELNDGKWGKDHFCMVCSTCGSIDGDCKLGTERSISDGQMETCDPGEGPIGPTTWPVNTNVTRVFREECPNCGEDHLTSTGETFMQWMVFKCPACGYSEGIWITTIYLKTLSGEIEEFPEEDRNED